MILTALNYITEVDQTVYYLFPSNQFCEERYNSELNYLNGLAADNANQYFNR